MVLGNVPKVISATALGKTIVIDGPEASTADEAQLLQEEQELELQDVHVNIYGFYVIHFFKYSTSICSLNTNECGPCPLVYNAWL